MQVKVPMGWFDSVVKVYNEDMIKGYWDKTGKYPILLLLFPFWLVPMLVYAVYLIFYGLMKLLVFIQEGGIMEPIFNMQNGFGKVILIIIVLPIAIILWLLSTLFPLGLVMYCVYWVLYWNCLHYLPFQLGRNERKKLQQNIWHMLLYYRRRLTRNKNEKFFIV